MCYRSLSYSKCPGIWQEQKVLENIATMMSLKLFCQK